MLGVAAVTLKKLVCSYFDVVCGSYDVASAVIVGYV